MLFEQSGVVFPPPVVETRGGTRSVEEQKQEVRLPCCPSYTFSLEPPPPGVYCIVVLCRTPHPQRLSTALLLLLLHLSRCFTHDRAL